MKNLGDVFAFFPWFLVCATLLGCKSKSSEVPQPFLGRWEADRLTTLEAVEMGPNKVRLIFEDGKTDLCLVDSVYIDNLFGTDFFREDEYLVIRCNRRAAPDRLACKGGRVLSWDFEVGALGDDAPHKIYMIERGGCYGPTEHGSLFRR